LPEYEIFDRKLFRPSKPIVMPEVTVTADRSKKGITAEEQNILFPQAPGVSQPNTEAEVTYEVYRKGLKEFLGHEPPQTGDLAEARQLMPIHLEALKNAPFIGSIFAGIENASKAGAEKDPLSAALQYVKGNAEAALGVMITHAAASPVIQAFEAANKLEIDPGKSLRKVGGMVGSESIKAIGGTKRAQEIAGDLAGMVTELGAWILLAKAPALFGKIRAGGGTPEDVREAFEIMQNARLEDLKNTPVAPKIKEIADAIEEELKKSYEGPTPILKGAPAPETPGIVKSQFDPAEAARQDRIRQLKQDNPGLTQADAEAFASGEIRQESKIVKPAGETSRQPEKIATTPEIVTQPTQAEAKPAEAPVAGVETAKTAQNREAELRTLVGAENLEYLGPQVAKDGTINGYQVHDPVSNDTYLLRPEEMTTEGIRAKIAEKRPQFGFDAEGKPITKKETVSEQPQPSSGSSAPVVEPGGAGKKPAPVSPKAEETGGWQTRAEKAGFTVLTQAKLRELGITNQAQLNRWVETNLGTGAKTVIETPRGWDIAEGWKRAGKFFLLI